MWDLNDVRMGSTSCLLIASLLIISVWTLPDPMSPEPDGPIVHLFEWRFEDIGKECSTFLASHGYGGVQVSPVHENIIIDGRPWYERYQPVSYEIASRSGSLNAFKEMVKMCNNVGVKVYVDVVFNHMSGTYPYTVHGTGESTVNTENYDYPTVPYNSTHFHDPCTINDWNNATQCRYCQLSGFQDLDQSQQYVREKMVHYLNKLLKIGVAGFRLDSVKHMDPADLKAIFEGINSVEERKGFIKGTKPFLYQDFFGYDTCGTRPSAYFQIGSVTDFKYAHEINRAFKKENPLNLYKDFGTSKTWGLVRDSKAIVFVDNHATQRGQFEKALTYKEPKEYKMAIAFMLSWPHGTPLIMSSYDFHNKYHGPPTKKKFQVIKKVENKNGNCDYGWNCEHRWKEISNMVKFRKLVGTTIPEIGKWLTMNAHNNLKHVPELPVENWWDNGNYQIAFSRGNKGFIVFNADDKDLEKNVQTGLPEGTYCDILSGTKKFTTTTEHQTDKKYYCSGGKITVDSKGFARITLSGSENGLQVQAYYEDAKL